MGVEVLGGGWDVSRHEKKRKKRRAYLVRPARCFPVPLWPVLAPPLCVPLCPLRFRRVAPSLFRVVMLLSAGSSWCRFGVPGASCGAFLH